MINTTKYGGDFKMKRKITAGRPEPLEIKQIFEKSGVSQYVLAGYLGISQSMVGLILNNYVEPNGNIIYRLQKLASAIEHDPDAAEQILEAAGE